MLFCLYEVGVSEPTMVGYNRKIMNRLHLLFAPILLVIITVWAWASLVNGSYFSHHDSQHIARLHTLYQGISYGSLYPRWVDLLGYGYGYPLFNFYPPLLYYVAAVFHALGASYVWSIKLVGIVGFIVAAWGIYRYTVLVSGSSLAAYLAAILYTYSPYHGVNLYVRGALAEFTAMAVLPFVFVGLEQLRQGHRGGGPMFALSLAALILAHPLIAFPAVFFILGYIAMSIITTHFSLRYFISTAVAGLLGLSMSAFFWLPSMIERKYTLVDTILTRELASYSIHFVYLAQLWSSAWGYGGSGPELADGMSFQIGKIHLILCAVSMVAAAYWLWHRRMQHGEWKHVFDRPVASYSAVGVMAAAAIYMTVVWSKPVWDAVSFLWYLQFPWRFLTFATLFVCVFASLVVVVCERLIVRKLPGQSGTYLLVAGIALVFVVLGMYSSSRFRPQEYWTGDDSHWTSHEEIAWRVSRTSHEFAPRGVATVQSQYATTIIDVSKQSINKRLYDAVRFANVRVLQDTYTNHTFAIASSRPFTFTLRRFSFPGWVATIDGRPVAISDNNRLKLMQIYVPAGSHEVKFAFSNTPVRLWASIISSVSAAACIAISIALYKKRI